VNLDDDRKGAGAARLEHSRQQRFAVVPQILDVGNFDFVVVCVGRHDSMLLGEHDFEVGCARLPARVKQSQGLIGTRPMGNEESMAEVEPGLIGKVFAASSPVEVTAEMIVDFCAAIGEPSPDTIGGKIVAPLSISGSFRAAEDIFDHLPKNERRLLASMELEFIEPIRAGDTIAIASAVVESYEKTGRSGTLVFTVIRTTLTNQHGTVVTRIDHRFTSRKLPD
jgi:acyl dehydratase